MSKKKILSVCLALVMALGVIVSAIPAVSAAGTMSFKDVKTTDWFYEYVKYVFERDLMKGTSSTTFGPDESMTRGQIVTILSRMSGDDVVGMSSEMNFKDVNKAEYYADPIGWAVKNGIAKGMTATTFEPETPVLRQEFAAFFVRYMNYKNITLPDAGEVTPFPDKAKFPDWATDNIETLQKTGLVKGDAKGNYNPASKMTRAEIATVTMRFTESVEALQPAGLPLEEIVTEYLDENLCITHSCLDLTFNYSSSLTEKNLADLLRREMDLPNYVSITFDCDFEEEFLGELKYSGMGNSGAGNNSSSNFSWANKIPITFKDTKAGNSYTATITFQFRKVLCLADMKGFYPGYKSLCPEDWDYDFHDREDDLEDFVYGEEEPFKFDGGNTPENIEAAARAATGITDTEKYPFFLTGFDPDVTDKMEISFGFYNKSEDIPDNVFDLIYATTWIDGSDYKVDHVALMNDAIDAFLEEYECVAHGDIHLTFPYASNFKPDFPAVILDALGLDPEKYELNVDDWDLDDAYDSFAGQGDGNSGSGEFTLTVTYLPTDEESKEFEISVYVRKMVGSGVSSLLMCADDSDLYDEGEKQIEKFLCENMTAHLDGEGLGDEVYHMIFRNADEFTEEAVKALVLKTTGMDDTYDVKFFDFNPDITAQQQFKVRVYKWYGKVIDMSREFRIEAYIDESAPAGGAFTKTHPVDPMFAIIEELDFIMETDDDMRLNFKFQTRSSLTAESFSDQVIAGVGLNPEIYEALIEDSEETIEELREIHGGLGHAQVWAYEPVGIALHNKVTGETTDYFDYRIHVEKDISEYIDQVEFPQELEFTYYTNYGPIESEEALNAWLTSELCALRDEWNEEYRFIEVKDFAAIKAQYDEMTARGESDRTFDFDLTITYVPEYNHAHYPNVVLDRTYSLHIHVPSK